MYRVVDLYLLVEVKLEGGLLGKSAVSARANKAGTDSLRNVHDL